MVQHVRVNVNTLIGPASMQRSPDLLSWVQYVLWCVCQCDGELVSSRKDHSATGLSNHHHL